MTMQRWYITPSGDLMSLDGAQPEASWVEVTGPRAHPNHVWLGKSWGFSKAALKEIAKDKRWRLEVAGVSVGKQLIATDDRSKLLINGAVNLLNEYPSLIEVDFDKGNCDFVTIPRDTMLGIGVAVGLHVQGLFTKLKAMAVLIDAGEITTPTQVESWEGWLK